MSNNHSQLGRVPSESSLENCHTQTDIDHLLTIDVVSADPSSSETPTTTTALVVNGTRQIQTVVVQNTPTTRQLARRRRRQRRRQRQRDRQIDIVHRQHQRQRRNWVPRSPRPNRPRRDYIPEQQIPRRSEGILWNLLSNRARISQAEHSPTDEALLDAYNLERIDLSNTWEQKQLYEFEGFVVLENPQLLSDEIEQQANIDAEERLKQTREHEQSEQQLLQFELCDHIDHLLLQMNQPLSHD